MEPELSRSHIKRNGHVLIILVLGEPETGDGQNPGTHSSQSHLLSKFQTTVKDVKDPVSKDKVDSARGITAKADSGLHMHMYTQACLP